MSIVRYPIAGGAAAGVSSASRTATPGAFDGLRATLDSGETAIVSVVGDSTGNAADEWVYLWATWLGTQYPAYTVRHRIFNLTTQNWDAPTVIQTGAAGTRYVDLDGATTACLLNRDTAINSVVGDLDARVHCAADVWTAGALIAKFGGTPNRAWRLYLGAGPTINFDWTTDGSTLQTPAAASLAGLVTAGVPIWLRVTLDVDNGATGHDIKFWRSTDGATWTQVGATVTRAGVTSIADVTEGVTVGARSLGGADRFDGKIYAAHVRAGIDGPIVTPHQIEMWEPTPSTYNGVTGGAPIIDVWNASCSAYGITDLNDATRLPKIFPPLGQALTVLSCSHNDSARVDALYWADWDTLLTHVRSRAPQTGVAVCAQNPKIGPAPWITQHAKRAGMIRGYAQRQSGSLVDVYGAFVAHPSGVAALTIADGIHPTVTPEAPATVTGSEVWRDTVIDAFLGTS